MRICGNMPLSAEQGEQPMSEVKFDRILVAIADPAAGMHKAVRRASALARSTGARIELFNAITAAMSEGTAHAAAEQFTRFEAEQNRRQLERTANRLRRGDIFRANKGQNRLPGPR